MAFGKIGQTLTAVQIFDLVRSDLDKVEKEIGLESIASVDAITYISQYLQSGGGKRLRPILVLLCGKLFGNSSPNLIRMAAVVAGRPSHWTLEVPAGLGRSAAPREPSFAFDKSPSCTRQLFS